MYPLRARDQNRIRLLEDGVRKIGDFTDAIDEANKTLGLKEAKICVLLEREKMYHSLIDLQHERHEQNILHREFLQEEIASAARLQTFSQETCGTEK